MVQAGKQSLSHVRDAEDHRRGVPASSADGAPGLRWVRVLRRERPDHVPGVLNREMPRLTGERGSGLWEQRGRLPAEGPVEQTSGDFRPVPPRMPPLEKDNFSRLGATCPDAPRPLRSLPSTFLALRHRGESSYCSMAAASPHPSGVRWPAAPTSWAF